MANKTSRWNGDTPLTKAHGGTKAAALLAVQEAKLMRLARDERRYADWERRGKPPSPMQPRKDRLRPGSGRHALREKLYAAQRGYCALCGFPLGVASSATIDHVVPRSAGGKDAGNRVLAHASCNNAKADRQPSQEETAYLLLVNARLASVDTHPQGEDAQQASASLSSAVPLAGDAQPSGGGPVS